MRIVAALLLVSLCCPVSQAAGFPGVKVMRFLGIHKGPGIHAPAPPAGFSGGSHHVPEAVWWEPIPTPAAAGRPLLRLPHEPLPPLEPLLPLPELHPPGYMPPHDSPLPEAAPQFQLQREARQGPHFFPLGR